VTLDTEAADAALGRVPEGGGAAPGRVPEGGGAAHHTGIAGDVTPDERGPLRCTPRRKKACLSGWLLNQWELIAPTIPHILSPGRRG